MPGPSVAVASVLTDTLTMLLMELVNLVVTTVKPALRLVPVTQANVMMDSDSSKLREPTLDLVKPALPSARVAPLLLMEPCSHVTRAKTTTLFPQNQPATSVRLTATSAQ
jgi:hypothetical protein